MDKVGVLVVVMLLLSSLVSVAASIELNSMRQTEFKLREELKVFKEQAFARGHMVQCLGRAGYYWECD